MGVGRGPASGGGPNVDTRVTSHNTRTAQAPRRRKEECAACRAAGRGTGREGCEGEQGRSHDRQEGLREGRHGRGHPPGPRQACQDPPQGGHEAGEGRRQNGQQGAGVHATQAVRDDRQGAQSHLLTSSPLHPCVSSVTLSRKRIRVYDTF